MRDRLIKAGLVAAMFAAAGLMYLAFDRGRDESEAPVRRGAVLRVFPQPSAVALRQDAIGVELSFGYTGSLTIDRRVIPDDQLDRIEGINRVSFTPGTGKEIEQLDEGRHCATIEYLRPVEDEPEPESFTWCFTVA